MSINFIPNDPSAGTNAPKLRKITPRPDRSTTVAALRFTGSVPEDLYQTNTPEFLFWQCREAALATLAAWEAAVGPHKRWQAGRVIALRQNAGNDMNAYYDRASVSFFEAAAGNQVFFSGASTDVVAHEVGHGLLDSVRPELWDSNFLEVNAFHEAFGDSIAIITALEDDETRKNLLSVAPSLQKRNFVESTAEALAKGIGLLQASHNAAEPRRAFNNFQYQLPSTLPDDGGPGKLINEAHSFGMLFTGCFWNLLANLFAAANKQDSATLLAVSRKAAALLVAAASKATHQARFFQSVGQAMVLADGQANGGANRQHIGNAFKSHGILLGSDAAVAPTMALDGNGPTKKGALTLHTRKMLAGVMAVGDVRELEVRGVDYFGTPTAEVTHERDIPLGPIDKRLKGVVAVATETAKVGASGPLAAVLGIIPNKLDTDAEVESYVASLLRHKKIAFQPPKRGAGKNMVADLSAATTTTHLVVEEGDRRVLRRVRFQCGR